MADLGKGGGARLAYEVGQDDGHPLVTLRGELDMTTAPELESAVEPVIAGAPERLIIDAGELAFADSSAIALLVRWANAVGSVEIRRPPELLHRVITRMGLSERLRVAP